MAEEQAPAPDPTPVAAPDVAAAETASPDTTASDAVAQAVAPPETGGSATIDPAGIDELLKQAQFDDATSASAGAPMPDGAAPFELANLQQVMRDAQVSSIELLRDVELNVKIELGRSRMLVEDVLKLAEGSVVELDKLAGDPVDVFVNDRLVARGEVLVLNDNFCVRVNEIVAGVKEEG
ncbi:MAG TPA: flagellar motor switch protein FliN [Tepidisphaeraceae bacterium]|nr:flagellar motor switch protein FliN [Tepidisphaeraceae bacterium]